MAQGRRRIWRRLPGPTARAFRRVRSCVRDRRRRCIWLTCWRRTRAARIFTRFHTVAPTSFSCGMAILFDLDGTLVDTIDLLLQSMRHAFEDYAGVPPSTEQWVAGIGTPLATQFRAFARDEDELQGLVARYRRYQQIHHDRLTRCYPGVLGVVRGLSDAGHRLAVVTSKADDMAHRTLAHVGLAPFFPLVVGVHATTRHKPDPEPVRFALAHLGAEPEGTFFVGEDRKST